MKEKNRGPDIDWDLVERVDNMYDLMPLIDIAKIVPRHYSTLKRWKQLGYISTEIDWQKKRSNKPTKADPFRATQLKRLGYSRKEIGEKLGVSDRTVTRYLKKNPK